MQWKKQIIFIRHILRWPVAGWIALLITGCGGKSPAYLTTPSVNIAASSGTTERMTGTPSALRGTISSNPATQLTHCQPQCFSPAWSPAGSQIAYFSGAEGIMLMDVNGGNAHPLTPRMAGWAPVWSPDGKRIAFTDSQGGALYVAADDGSGLTRISDPLVDPQINPSYAWSPDGESLAFVTVDGKESGLWTTEANGGKPRSIFRDPSPVQILGWPDGAHIYLLVDQTEGPAVYRIRVDGSEKKQLTQLASEAMDITLSPDGAQIVFNSVNADGVAVCFWVLAMDDSPRRMLLPQPGVSPAWSPDGKRLAFAAREGDMEIDLYVMNADGSGRIRATKNPGYADDTPVWSPDGLHLAFVSRTFTADGFGADDQIYVVDVPGT